MNYTTQRNADHADHQQASANANAGTEASEASEAAFMAAVNATCERVSLNALDSQMADEMFFYECAREQIKKYNPKARSYGIIHQLIATDPRTWAVFPSFPSFPGSV